MPALDVVSPTRGPPKGTGVLGEEEQQERWAGKEQDGSTLTCRSMWGLSLPLSRTQFPLLYSRFCTTFNRFL